jgi:hypothetical protein
MAHQNHPNVEHVHLAALLALLPRKQPFDAWLRRSGVVDFRSVDAQQI